MRNNLTKYYKEFLFAIIAYIGAQVIIDGPDWNQWYGGIFEELVEFVLALALVICISLWRVQREVLLLLDSIKSLDRKYRRPITRYFLKNLQDHLQGRLDIVQKGLFLNAEELKRFVLVNFDNNKGTYQGTDSHVPSSFYRFYPNYLESQCEGRNTKKDVRFLLILQDKLQKDLEEDSGSSELFYRWHMTNGIRLFQVDPQVAAHHASLQGIPSTEIGVFDAKYAAFYKPPYNDNSKYKIWVWPLEKEKAQKVRLYLKHLNENAKEIVFKNKQLQFRERERKELVEDEKKLSCESKR